MTLMFQMGERLKQICACTKLVPAKHLSLSHPVKNDSFKRERELKDLQGERLIYWGCARVAAREEMSEFYASFIHLDNLREQRHLSRSAGN